MKNNITPAIESKIGIKLHTQHNHPLEILKRKIYAHFGESFAKFDNLPEFVTVRNNFDLLLIPEDHPSRRITDTFYQNASTVLRTHTSAHQNVLLHEGYDKFLVTGDCYRRDEIDATHYPIFHQMEGVKIIKNADIMEVKRDLLKTLTGLVRHLFPDCLYRVVDSQFPFTTPSFEFEVNWNDKWIEVLGCGVIHPGVMKNAGREGEMGWAFGLGLERLAMILFDIPDIRLFWTNDERFHKQFTSGEIVKFKEYSKYPVCYKDIAFWIGDNYNYNDFCAIVRENANDLVESIEKIDEFTNPKTNRVSHCYRINYRSHSRSLSNEEVNQLFEEVRKEVKTQLGVEVR